MRGDGTIFSCRSRAKIANAAVGAAVILLGAQATGLLLTDLQASDAVSFADHVRPILSDRCFTCHGPDEATRTTAFRLDTQEGAFVPLASGGFAIVRGKPEESQLLQRATSNDPIRRMPPSYLGHEKLDAKEIDTLRRWIEQGAPYQSHWAFVPPAKPAMPAVRNKGWTRNEIDYLCSLAWSARDCNPPQKPTGPRSSGVLRWTSGGCRPQKKRSRPS